MAESDIQIVFSVKVEGEVQFKDLQKSIKNLQSASNSTEKSLQKFNETTKKGKSETASFGDRVAKATARFSPMAVGIQLVTKAVNLAFTAFQQLGKFLLEAPFAFAQAEKSANRLAVSLQNQGIASSHVRGMYKNFAKEMQEFSGVAVSTTTDLLTLATNNGLFGQKAMEAVKAAHSLSLGLNIDLSSAMQKIVGAFQNGVEDLNRYKLGLVETGDKAKDFENALKTIQDRYGQLAGADADNLITKTQVLKQNWNEFKELLGQELAPTMNKLVEYGNKFLSSLSYMKSRSADQKEYIKLIDRENYLLSIRGKKAYNQTLVEKQLAEIAARKGEIEKANYDNLKKQKEETIQAEKEIAAAQAKVAKDQADKKKAEDKKKETEKQVQAEQQTAKRISDFKLNQESETLKQISELRASANAIELTEKYNLYRQSYEARIDYLNQQVEKIREASGEEVALASEVFAQKQILQEQYDKFITSSKEVIQEEAGIFAEFDVWLTENATQRKIKILQGFTAFQQSNIKALQVIGKASAIATTTIDTYKMAVEAYSAMAGIPIIGPALGAAAAAAAIAFGLEQIANISGVQFASGTDFVPQDMQATVHQGEIIIPKTFAEAIRAGDLTLSGGVSTTENRNSQATTYYFSLNIAGDVITESNAEFAEKMKEAISEGIASGRFTPFPTKERM